MLNAEQIVKRFHLAEDCEEEPTTCSDTRELLRIQALGFEHGKTGTVPEDFEFEVELPVEQAEGAMLAPEGSVMRLYRAAVREGAAAAKAAVREGKAAKPVAPARARRSAVAGQANASCL